MNITLIGPTYPFRGGISHYTTLLCQALRERHEVHFITYRRQYPTWLYPGRSDQDPTQDGILRCEAEPLIDSLNPLTWWQSARAIRARQPDLLLLQWTVSFWGPLLLLLVALTRRWAPRTRIVLLCHNAQPHERGGALGSRVAAWMQRTVARQSHGILCHSTADLAEMARMAPQVPGQVVMLPTYQSLAQQAELPSRSHARAQFDLSHAEPLLLFFGFVRPYKGVDVLFRAMPRVLEQFPEAALIVAGEWWEDARPALALLGELGLSERVRLLDDYLPNDQLPALFAAANVVVLPYRSATQSAVIQLAYGFGVPVITTAVGGLPDAVRHEETGFLVPPDDPAALAAAIVRYHQEGWESRLAPGVAAARQRFSWEAMVEAIERVARATTHQ